MIVRQFYSFALFQLRRAVCSPFRFSARGSTSLGHNWVAWRSLERSKDHRQDLVVPDTTRHSGLPAPTRTIPCWFTNHLLQWWWWWRWWRRLVLAGWCLQVGACRLVLAGWCLQVGTKCVRSIWCVLQSTKGAALQHVFHASLPSSPAPAVTETSAETPEQALVSKVLKWRAPIEWAALAKERLPRFERSKVHRAWLPNPPDWFVLRGRFLSWRSTAFSRSTRIEVGAKYYT